MGANTEISWAHHTFNPWYGCTKVSPACDHCYAESWAKRSGLLDNWGKDRRRSSPAKWKEPLKWNVDAASRGIRYRVFGPSLGDPFDNQIPDPWRADYFDLMRKCDHLDFLLLTKRPQNVQKMLPAAWGSGWSNVWLGTTIENQPEADKRREYLKAIPAVVKFVSYEPALGDVDWRGWEFLSWLISGGESGPKARPSHPDWHRKARDWCAANGAAYHFKQWGEWASAKGMPSHLKIGHVFDDGYQMIRIGKKAAGRILDGRTHDAFPSEGGA